MYSDISVVTACSVSKEFVDMIARQFPEKLVDALGNVKVEETLKLLGFRVGGFNYQYHKNVLIRDAKVKSRVYRTDVYVGRLRTNMTKQGEYGKALYNLLFDMYSKDGVVQPSSIYNNEFFDILEIGSLAAYNKEKK